jgi:hypothetical protein
MTDTELTKQYLQSCGFFIRMTEWEDGFQCGAHLKRDRRYAYISKWYKTEVEAWDDVMRQVNAAKYVPLSDAPEQL